MGLFSSKKHRRNVSQAGGGGRSAEDYGIPGLTDAQLQELAGNAGKYGEKSGLAGKEYQSRLGIKNQADMYRAALEKAAYSDAGRQYGQGLDQISNFLARSGPMADSGAANAYKARLASQIYGQAQGRIGGGYADYLGNILNQNRQYGYQRSLALYQSKLNKPKPYDYLFAAAGGIGGAAFGGGRGGGGGYGAASSPYQASDAYYG